jgi:hypothetical protein
MTTEEYKQELISIVDIKNEFITGDDGYVYYWPEGNRGCLSSFQLRIIADELDNRNEKWDKQITEYINNHNNPKSNEPTSFED